MKMPKLLLSVLLLCMSFMLFACNKPVGEDKVAQQGGRPTHSEADAASPPDSLPQEADVAANPCAAMTAGEGLRMRGVIRMGDKGLLFTPCNSTQSVPIQDSEIGLLSQMLEQLGEDTGSIYVQMDVNSDGSKLALTQLWRASPLNDSIGCEEDQTGLLYLARGNEPFWGMEVRDSGKIALLLPGEDGQGIREILYDHTSTEQLGQDLVISGTSPDNAGSCSLTIRKVPSIDSMSGEWFGLRADMRYSDMGGSGSAWPGEASEFRELP